jgi:1,2-diacylglycerol 3-beta-galactosyltransferase
MPHILFLMSDTGGGHRAAARAIEAALQERHPSEFTVELVDVWKDYYPFPFNTLPHTYSRWVNASPFTYSAQFWIMDRLVKWRGFSKIYNWAALGRMKRLFNDHPADLVVCVHSVFAIPAAYAIKRLHPTVPFITVITDYALPPTAWYSGDADRTLVPTEPAYQRGLQLGLRPEQMVLTGAPVHPKFSKVTLTKHEARTELGWQTDKPIVLLVAGGDGMGPLVATAQAVDAQSRDFELTVIAGRNQAMKASLEAINWQHKAHIYGFVDNIQVMMKAADLMITKAGPATITEAAILGLPVVLSGAIKYQESPNVDYVVEHGAGVSAPGPERVAQSVYDILDNNGAALAHLTDAIRRLAQPDAVGKIADEIWALWNRKVQEH